MNSYWDKIYILNLEHQKYKFDKIVESLKKKITKNIKIYWCIWIKKIVYGKEIENAESINDKWLFAEKMNHALQKKI